MSHRAAALVRMHPAMLTTHQRRLVAALHRLARRQWRRRGWRPQKRLNFHPKEQRP